MSDHTIKGHLEVLAAPRELPAEPRLFEASIVENRHVADRYWFMRLHAPHVARYAQPGQFAMLTISSSSSDGPVLPRPMAIYATAPDQGTFDIMYGAVGAGTRKMASIPQRQTIKVVGPLGRGFSIVDSTRRVLLVGRGIGTCSLTMLGEAARRQGVAVVAVDSARTREALMGAAAYRASGAEALIEVVDAESTSDPAQLKSRLTRALSRPPDQIFTCGSTRLLNMCLELGRTWGADVQVSIEAHMACGIGYCHGCSSGERVATAEAPLVCKHGPAFGAMSV